MAADYSKTVNKSIELDAYPLPRIEGVVNEVPTLPIAPQVCILLDTYKRF